MRVQLSDPFGVTVNLRAIEVGVAVFTGDFIRDARLERLPGAHDGGALSDPGCRASGAGGWALRLRSDAGGREAAC